MQMEAYGASVKANNPINWESDILRGSIFQKWRKDRDFPSGPVAGLYRPVQGVQVWFLVGSYDPTCLVAKTPKHKKRKGKEKKKHATEAIVTSSIKTLKMVHIKNLLKNEGKIKTFSHIQKLQEFITSRTTQQEMLKRVLQAEGAGYQVEFWI